MSFWTVLAAVFAGHFPIYMVAILIGIVKGLIEKKYRERRPMYEEDLWKLKKEYETLLDSMASQYNNMVDLYNKKWVPWAEKEARHKANNDAP